MSSKAKTVKAWHTIDEALAYLSRNGFNVSENSLRSSVERGRLEVRKVGRHPNEFWMFSTSELDRLLNASSAAVGVS